METLEQVVSILSSAIGIGVGLVAVLHLWRTRRLPSPKHFQNRRDAAVEGLQITSPQTTEPASSHGARLTSYRDETALEKPRQPALLRPVFLVGGAVVLIPAALAFSHRSTVGFVWTFYSAFCFYMAYATGLDRSATLKTASLTVELPVDEVMHRSHDVLRSLDLKITSFDLSTGVIEARRGMNRHTLGELVTVQVESEGSSHSGVVVVSDSALTFTMADWWGANQRNVDRFVSGLLGR